MDVKDIIVTPFVLLIILMAGYAIKNSFPKNSPVRGYVLPGLWVKVLGSLAFCFIYFFYYKGGDTLAFYNGTKIFWEILKHDSYLLFRMFMASPATYPSEAVFYVPENYHWILAEPQSFFLVKIASFIGFFTFNTYSSISIVFAFLSFTGLLALYLVFYDLYPKLHKPLAIVILFIPGVIFWGSGLMKDTVTLGSSGWLIWGFYHAFIKRDRKTQGIIVILLASFLITKIKAYIFVSIAPALLFWAFSYYRSQVKNRFLRMAIGPFVIIMALALNYVVVVGLGAQFKNFSPDAIIGTAAKYQSWHEFVSEDQQGSGYTLGDYEPTLEGALKQFIPAVNVTLYRPYLWEVKKPIMLVSSIESTAMLIFTLIVIIRAGPFRAIRIGYTNPEAMFCLFFTIFFAFAIGFSTYNFGALVRYKIPCIPLFLAALIIINYLAKKEKIEMLGQER